MPVYCYTTEDGETVEEFRQAPQSMPDTLTLPDGRVARRDYMAEHKGGNIHGKWPIFSVGAAVHPKQIAEEEAYLRGKGVECKHLKDGRKIFESPAHRKAVLKAKGMVDLAGYDG